MTAIDHLIARGIADPDRLGVMGWSYGGYLTASIVTQTKRFKAASIGPPRSIGLPTMGSPTAQKKSC